MRTIKKLFGEYDIVGMTFRHTPSPRKIEKADAATYYVSTPQSTLSG